ncbi:MULTISPECIES: c-type cytochrome biogenesis protein CcmI [Thalassospira]|uniref:c-type cytochrome biogenesis protein CcmI n=1 Tax=Thalassospira TaxID=168934 RepID=UPI0008DCC91A|nr:MULTISPECIES: c-type cytochrome biogenesis protein CcmI [Thalassospira]MAB35142.1 c-type cytochrome biogenesis protein CcmI [Thalassospira sp.]MDM7976675.1 c-type cytochrome biogenesis protein CcmI [Thalassospira xiamenensis]OHY98589.1 c-type cytochrome biogenesis protein CcmI [Thalassospira sp. MIT1004]HBS24032.1 c-type cytochrome biogenesis protein CcmI [Thalassospira sp.]
MTIWIVLGALTALVAGYVLWPILRNARSASADAGDDHLADMDEDELQRDLAVYRDQLAEIGRDIERGVLTGEQADAARTEVQRRILATDQRISTRQKSGEAATRISRLRPAVAIFTLLLFVGGIGLYLDFGRPDLRDRPIASRTDEIMAARQASENDASRNDALNRAVQDLSNRLLENPDDLKGWELLGASLMALGRAEEAQTAFLEAVKQSGRDGDYLAMYAESVIRANNGQVNTIARGALEEAAQSGSKDPRIQYFLGLADAQNGNVAAAIDRWIVLVNGAPSDAGWLPMVLARIDEAALAQGIDITGRIKITPPMASNAPAGPRGPSREDMEAAAEMSPEERQEMILGMVSQLADKLAENPENPEGWARLIRAYMVIGQPDQAKQAYDNARQVFSDDTDLLTRFAGLADELGIPAN